MIRLILRNILVFSAVIAGAAHAQESYPKASKPIFIVVPFAAGSGTDSITRLIAEKMARNMNANILVDNKPGANGQIGTEYVAKSPADGYTLLVATNSTHSANQYLYKKIRYHPVKDFAPIGLLNLNPLVLLTKPDSAFRTIPDLIKFAQANPDKLSYGFGNTGGQVAAAMLVNGGKFKALDVPYKTTPQLLNDLMGGQVDFAFIDFAASMSLLKANKLKAIAISSPKRVKVAGDVPAVSETNGYAEFQLFSWLGLVAPAGTPKPIIDRLNVELRSALNSAEVRSRLEGQMGSIVEPKTVAEFSAFMQEQDAIWKRRIYEAGIQPE